MRRTRPASVSARSTSYTAWWDTSPRSPRTTEMIESVSACGCSCTADSTATRGRVTRSAAPRSMRSSSAFVGTLRSMAPSLESVKNGPPRRRDACFTLTSSTHANWQHGSVRNVVVDAVEIARLMPVLSPDRAERLRAFAARARQRLRGRTVWNINATASGGGVAEMLQTILAYGRGAGVDTRWLVLDANPEFFRITKRLHNVLHGSAGDGGGLGERERAHYGSVLGREPRPQLRALCDPATSCCCMTRRPRGSRTASGRPGPRSSGVATSGGTPTPSSPTRGWDFSRAYVRQAGRHVFSRRPTAPSGSIPTGSCGSSRPRWTRSAPRTSISPPPT